MFQKFRQGSLEIPLGLPGFLTNFFPYFSPHPLILVFLVKCFPEIFTRLEQFLPGFTLDNLPGYQNSERFHREFYTWILQNFFQRSFWYCFQSSSLNFSRTSFCILRNDIFVELIPRSPKNISVYFTGVAVEFLLEFRSGYLLKISRDFFRCSSWSFPKRSPRIYPFFSELLQEFFLRFLQKLNQRFFKKFSRFFCRIPSRDSIRSFSCIFFSWETSVNFLRKFLPEFLQGFT